MGKETHMFDQLQWTHLWKVKTYSTFVNTVLYVIAVTNLCQTRNDFQTFPCIMKEISLRKFKYRLSHCIGRALCRSLQHRRLIRVASWSLTQRLGGVCDIDGRRLAHGCSRQLPTHCSKSQMLPLSLLLSPSLSFALALSPVYFSSCASVLHEESCLTRWGICTN